jgi:hypothetical protein|nr:MAG TPA: hypothetical protein [Caudoviricetes sp.]
MYSEVIEYHKRGTLTDIIHDELYPAFQPVLSRYLKQHKLNDYFFYAGIMALLAEYIEDIDLSKVKKEYNNLIYPIHDYPDQEQWCRLIISDDRSSTTLETHSRDITSTSEENQSLLNHITRIIETIELGYYHKEEYPKISLFKVDIRQRIQSLIHSIKDESIHEEIFKLLDKVIELLYYFIDHRQDAQCAIHITYLDRPDPDEKAYLPEISEEISSSVLQTDSDSLNDIIVDEETSISTLINIHLKERHITPLDGSLSHPRGIEDTEHPIQEDRVSKQLKYSIDDEHYILLSLSEHHHFTIKYPHGQIFYNDGLHIENTKVVSTIETEDVDFFTTALYNNLTSLLFTIMTGIVK